jgi:hypothetical protein
MCNKKCQDHYKVLVETDVKVNDHFFPGWTGENYKLKHNVEVIFTQ